MGRREIDNEARNRIVRGARSSNDPQPVMSGVPHGNVDSAPASVGSILDPTRRSKRLRSSLRSAYRLRSGEGRMSDQFQHVMVLASIIIGLGITHALLGFSTVIDRISGARERLRLSWAWAFWLAFVFIWKVQFWWWEFRLLSVLKTWSMSNYLLVIVYAVVLFLLVAVLVPRRWEEVDDLGAYFLSKRKWFYAVFALGMALDVVDSAMKGGLAYIEASGPLAWMQWVAAAPAAVVGFRSGDTRVHTGLAIMFFTWTAVIGFEVLTLLKR
jgi:hypothetical protein